MKWGGPEDRRSILNNIIAGLILLAGGAASPLVVHLVGGISAGKAFAIVIGIYVLLIVICVIGLALSGKQLKATEVMLRLATEVGDELRERRLTAIEDELVRLSEGQWTASRDTEMLDPELREKAKRLLAWLAEKDKTDRQKYKALLAELERVDKIDSPSAEDRANPVRHGS